MDWKSLVGNTATVVTIGSLFAGGFVCWNISKKGTTGELSSLPFVAGTLCSVLWLRYGLYLNDSSLIYVNSTGVFLNFFYTFFFYLYTTSKPSFHKQVLLVSATLVSLTVYLMFVAKNIDAATFVSGMTACAGSLFFCASPLVALADVFRNRSVSSLPFPVISSTFAVTALWFFYGVLVNDNFIKVPNFLGALLSGFQLVLFAIYPSKPSGKLEVS